MSDSIKKYNELVEDGIIQTDYMSPEQSRDYKIMALLAKATKANVLAQVEMRAEEVRKEFGTTSLLLGLEIAVDELVKDE
mgnify:FL=1|jgi:hypothetical protein